MYQPLTYNITWGDEVYDQAMSSASIFMNSVINQVTTFEHTYNRVGTFTVSIEVKAQNGRTAKTTQTVTVINPSYVGTGTLYGKLSIGPICPVETYPPQPNCLPNYANDPIVIYQSNKTTFVQNVVADTNGNFSVQLPTGTYWVRVPSRESNFGSQRGVPTYIEITRGNSVNLNIDIDTGIR